MSSFAQWFPAPENRPALLAVRRMLRDVCSERNRQDGNPLVLHGPTGSGKTHLVEALVSEAVARKPDLIVATMAASDLRVVERNGDEAVTLPLLNQAREADLLVVEDLQHLPAPAVEGLVQVFDHRLARRRPIVCTALAGPGQLRTLPARLTARLAGGLIVGLVPLTPATRLNYLHWRTEQRQLLLAPEVLEWLAHNVGGSARLLDGALARLGTLARLQGTMPDVETTAQALQQDADTRRPTVERIAQRVGQSFRLDPRLLRNRDRSRHVLWPRQVGMYLARELTGLSLGQIGAYFGGRDHSTVLHACRKVEEALHANAQTSGLVRQLHAELE